MVNTKKMILRVGIVGCGRIVQSHNHAYSDQLKINKKV